MLKVKHALSRALVSFLLIFALACPALAASRIVGAKVDVSSHLEEELFVAYSYNYMKVWVYCESGSVTARIINEDGTTVACCGDQNLVSGSGTDSYIFWVPNDPSYEGKYYLSLDNNAPSTSYVWYHAAESK